MNAQQELSLWLRDWTAVSERIERLPVEACLTSDQIVAFVDEDLDVVARLRAAEHLGDCSYCSRQVASVYLAAQAFEERQRVRSALGSVGERLAVCLRVFVDETRGAFTRLDALLQGLVPSAQLTPVLVPAGATRGRLLGEEEVEVPTDPEVLHEVTIEAGSISGAELLCGEEDGGSVTVSLPEPCEVRLIAPDGRCYTLPVEAGEERHYATMAALPPGEYLLTILRPDFPRPPSA